RQRQAALVVIGTPLPEFYIVSARNPVARLRPKRYGPILGGAVDSLRVVWDFYCPRRSRRRTPIGPPPRDLSTGAKGSRLPRRAGRVIFAAQLRVGAEAAQREEMP